MRFQSTIIILAALSAPLTIAAPIPGDDVSLMLPQGLYVCDRYGFSGHCEMFRVPYGHCSKCNLILFPWKTMTMKVC
jgi:hypothetical protein